LKLKRARVHRIIEEKNVKFQKNFNIYVLADENL
jgi:hypothetical protein